MKRLILAGLAATLAAMGSSVPTASATEAVPPPITVAYGDEPSQFGELWLPAGAGDSAEQLPVVVLVHGGFWHTPYDRELMDPLAADLTQRGMAVWNIEYRRVGEPGGGWPGTFDDVAAAVDELADLGPEYGLDLDDVTVVGHSAGGHLAFWSAGRSELPESAPGAGPAVEPTTVIGLGAVADLRAALTDGVGGSAVADLLGGGPAEVPDRFAAATPNIPASATAVSIRGADDTIVPPDYSVPVGDGRIEVIDVDGDDHFDLIDPASPSWAEVLGVLGTTPS